MKYLSTLVPTTFAALLFTFANTASAYAGDNPCGGDTANQDTGVVHHGKVTMDSLKSNGRVTLEGTTVKNLLHVNGSIYSHKASIGKLNVGGHAHLSRSKILGKSEVSGTLNAEKCTFGNKIVLTGQKMSLQNCKVKSIFIKKTYWPFTSQVIELSKNSICKGKITFESGKGRIIVKDGSKVLGKVRGAKIEKVKPKK